MSKQWGHGYYKGIEAAQANNGTLAGLWFHSRHDGDLGWQGQVVRDLENGQYVVQLFEWGMGNPTVQKIVPAADMAAWDFFGTNDDMKEAAERHWDKQGMKPRIDRIPNTGRQVRREEEIDNA